MGYIYYMGKYEVTNAQYCQFLNAKLPTISDTPPMLAQFCPVTRTACTICATDDAGSQWWNQL